MHPVITYIIASTRVEELRRTAELQQHGARVLGQFRDLNPNQPRVDWGAAVWIFPYLIGMGVVSYFGTFGSPDGGRGGIIGGVGIFKSVLVGGTNALGLYRSHISKDVIPDDVEISCEKPGYRQTKVYRRTPPGAKDMLIETECTLQRL